MIQDHLCQWGLRLDAKKEPQEVRILKAPKPLPGVSGGKTPSAEDSVQGARNEVSRKRNAKKGRREIWIMDTRRENWQGRAPKYVWEKVTRTFSTSWMKNVSIGAKWKECRTKLRSTKVVQLHERLKKKSAGQAPRRGWCSTMERRGDKTSQEDGMVDSKIEGVVYPNQEIWIHGGVQEVEQLHTDGDDQPMEDCAKLRNVREVTEAAELNRTGLSRRWIVGMWRKEIRVKRYKLESNVGEGWSAYWELVRQNREGRAWGKEAKKRKKVLRQIKNVLRNLNQLENGEEYAHKLSWNACTWHELVGLTFFGRWTHLLDQSRNEQEHAANV